MPGIGHIRQGNLFGNSNEIDKILSNSDLFLLPSETESFGLAALEAMAWGVPVISSNSGGLPEVNFEGVSGYLSNVGNVDEMAENALKILKDDTILAQFKENALAVAQKFDIKHILPLYIDIYEKALKKYTKKSIPLSLITTKIPKKMKKSILSVCMVLVLFSCKTAMKVPEQKSCMKFCCSKMMVEEILISMRFYQNLMKLKCC